MADDCRSCSFYDECASRQQKPARSVQLSVVADGKQAMKEKLTTPEGKQLYAVRRETVERVFANIKSNKGLNRFNLSGLSGAKSEFWLACATHNLMICVRKAVAARLPASYAAHIVGFMAVWAAVLLVSRPHRAFRPAG